MHGMNHSVATEALIGMVASAQQAGHTVVYVDSEASFKPPPVPVFEWQNCEPPPEPALGGNPGPFWKQLPRYRRRGRW